MHDPTVSPDDLRVGYELEGWLTVRGKETVESARHTQGIVERGIT